MKSIDNSKFTGPNLNRTSQKQNSGSHVVKQMNFRTPESENIQRFTPKNSFNQKVNHDMQNLKGKYCEVCDMFNHNTVDCYFNKFCHICQMRNHLTTECYFNKYCAFCDENSHNTADCYFKKKSYSNAPVIPSFQRNPKVAFQNSREKSCFGVNTSKSKSFQKHDLNAPKFKSAQSFVPRSVMRKVKETVSG